jgi:hypothetical protein
MSRQCARKDAWAFARAADHNSAMDGYYGKNALLCSTLYGKNALPKKVAEPK